MQDINQFIEGNPLAVPVIVAVVIGLYVVLRQLKITLRRGRRKLFYEVAREMNLQVIKDISVMGVDIPRIGGVVAGRQVDISGYEKPTRAGVMRTVMRITIPHNTYLVRSVTLEYNSVKNPPLQKIKLDGKESTQEDLLALDAFDSQLWQYMSQYLEKYSRGRTMENAVMSFSVGKATFDREISQAGNMAHLMDSVMEFTKIIKYMEAISRSHTPPSLETEF